MTAGLRGEPCPKPCLRARSGGLLCVRWLCACLLLSGMSGLIYEVAWVRSLELIFGATTFAVATVLASFMGGLATGA